MQRCQISSLTLDLICQMQTIISFRDSILRTEEYRAHEAEARVYVDDDRSLTAVLPVVP